MDRMNRQAHPARHAAPALRTALLALALLASGATSASAASIKLSGFWLDGVEVLDIREGKLVYTNAAGAENSAELSKLEGVKMPEIPQLEAGLTAAEKGDHATAIRQFTVAMRSAEQPWLQSYVRWQLMRAQDGAGELDDAVNTFVALARAGSDPYFLSTPPLASIATADAKMRKDTAVRLQRGLGGARGAARTALESYLETLQATLEGGSADATEAVKAAVTQASIRAGNAPQAADPELVLPARMDLKDPVTQLLLQAKYQEALDLVNRGLAATSADMSLRLYQKGLAQMGLARQQNDNADLYKDAGLSFMRLLVHQARTITDYHGAAMLEVGVVHEKIGRPDKAADLYQRASLLIDLEREPALQARLAKLTGLADAPEVLNGAAGEETPETP